MGSRSYVTPLLGDDRFIKIGRKKFIQMDGLLVHSTNPFDFSIKEGMYVHIYHENFPGISEKRVIENSISCGSVELFSRCFYWWNILLGKNF